ncbi:hypothetical protein GGR56DRAFT_649918 [Xylariaceae sp. FL0804]|nr:hypothetical protein GGR56DRAFT_649918 [Xylariaceae sp. FL0804]
MDVMNARSGRWTHPRAHLSLVRMCIVVLSSWGRAEQAACDEIVYQTCEKAGVRGRRRWGPGNLYRVVWLVSATRRHCLGHGRIGRRGRGVRPFLS